MTARFNQEHLNTCAPGLFYAGHPELAGEDARQGTVTDASIAEQTRASALKAFTQRLEHDRATELAITLDEIADITRLRLSRLVSAASAATHHEKSLPS